MITSANWLPVLGAFVAPSLMMIAIACVLAGFAPKRAEEAKQNLPTIIFGVILFSLAGAIGTMFMTAAGTTPAAALPIFEPMAQAIQTLV